jgi:hypothetical protein
VARHKYTQELLEPIVRESLSVSEVLVRLGLRISGGAHDHVKRRIAAYGLDTSHFLGQRRNRGPAKRGGPAKLSPEEMLTLREPSSPVVRVYRVRRALLESGRPHVCVVCGLGPLWRGEPLVLQVDHLNGLHHDYRPENLRFLCPNCHSQTLNFARRNRAYAEVAKRQTHQT